MTSPVDAPGTLRGNGDIGRLQLLAAVLQSGRPPPNGCEKSVLLLPTSRAVPCCRDRRTHLASDDVLFVSRDAVLRFQSATSSSQTISLL